MKLSVTIDNGFESRYSKISFMHAISLPLEFYEDRIVADRYRGIYETL